MTKRGRPKHPELLTPREQEVLALLREGLTNPQIAERLGIGLEGVKYHVSEILSKLHVSTRDEAARWRGDRPWWLGALAFFRPPVRAASIAAAGGVLVAAAVGLVLLAVLLWRGSGDGADEQVTESLFSASNSYRHEALRIAFEYPRDWREGASLRTYEGDVYGPLCQGCVVFGPPVASQPYGVYLYSQRDFDRCIGGDAWRCPVGPRASGGIRARQQAQDRLVETAGTRAGQAEVIKNVPLGVTNQTGEIVPDREIWTFIPLRDDILVMVAFWREGDRNAERATRGGYDMILSSLAIE